MISAAVSGFITALSLIAAIGAQNAFVLRQGLRREHVLAVVLTCAISDAILITAGVAGFGSLTKSLPWLTPVMLWLGAGFLIIYGALRFVAAYRGGAALMPAQGQHMPRRKTLAICLMLTWANPHVYLDTLVLLGAISARYTPDHWGFGIGAVAASFSFFMALGFGARLLAPIFAKPRAWVVLEILIGLVMWALAIGLMLQA